MIEHEVCGKRERKAMVNERSSGEEQNLVASFSMS